MSEELRHIYRSEAQLLGREYELGLLDQVLQAPETRTMVVTGDRGVGKTSLMSNVYGECREHGLVFESYESFSAFEQKWHSVLDLLCRRIMPSQSKWPRDPDGLVRSLVRAAERPHLIFIDNVESDALRDPGCQSFLSLWATQPHSSVLLLTTRDQSDFPDLPNTYVLHLQGVTEESAILGILGRGLCDRFERSLLLSAAASLGNTPQKLLYLRWNDPRSEVAFHEAVQVLAAASAPAPVNQILKTVSASADHFVALGLLRTIEPREELIAFLWDSLVARSSADYEEAKRFLIEQRLLVVSSTQDDAYRVHPDVHLDLRRIAEAKGRQWLHRVHSAAAEFYRAKSSWGLNALNEFVYHSIELRDFASAFGAVFNVGSLDRWHSLGLALQLEPIVQQLNESSSHFSAVNQARILVELGQIHSDLSRHYRSLEYLPKALDIVANEPDVPSVRELRRDAWRLLAISNGDTGNTDDTIRYYSAVIRLDPDALDPRTALSMGYLGYAYCDFQKFDEAEFWTEQALAKCPETRDCAIFTKNLCNRALVFYYSGQLSPARTYLERATQLAGDTHSPGADTREHGRILGYLGLVYLSQPDVALHHAEQTLRKAMELNQASGDLRRAAICYGRLGIVESRRQNLGLAVEMLSKAIQDHLRINDYRNLILELLDLASILVRAECASPAQLLQEAQSNELLSPPIPELMERTLHDTRYQEFLSLWFQRIRPLVFPDGTSA